MTPYFAESRWRREGWRQYRLRCRRPCSPSAQRCPTCLVCPSCVCVSWCIYIAGKRKLFFYIYAVIVKQKINKRSSNYYSSLPALMWCFAFSQAGSHPRGEKDAADAGAVRAVRANRANQRATRWRTSAALRPRRAPSEGAGHLRGWDLGFRV